MRQGELDRRKVAQAWADLNKEEIALLLAARAVMVEKARGIDFNDLTDYHREFVSWKLMTDFMHATECQDPDCDAIVCRAARGLPALTRDDIEAQREVEKERQQGLQEHAREVLSRRFNRPASRNGTGGNHATH